MATKTTRPGAQTHDSAPVEVCAGQFQGRGTRVLVVDDMPGMRAVAATILRSAGYEVETAAGGREALSRVKHARPDLVLLDLNMPDVDGFEVLQALRGEQARPPMPVVVFSGVDDSVSRLRAAALGAAGFVTKRGADAFVLRQEVDQHIDTPSYDTV